MHFILFERKACFHWLNLVSSKMNIKKEKKKNKNDLQNCKNKRKMMQGMVSCVFLTAALKD